MSRTGVAHHETHEIPENGATEASFSISVTSRMAPAANVIVYYIQSTGEIIYDKMKIHVENPMPNFVSFKDSDSQL